MDEKIQARVMEPFFTTKEVGSGTGLGLSIAFGIIQRHSGNLTFTSTPGLGSQFTVHLPIEKPPSRKYDL
jgi:signal transduction histidine kinase